MRRYKTDFSYDKVGNLTNIKESIDGRNLSTVYDYNKDYRPTKVTYGQSLLEYNYKDPASQENIGRLFEKTLTVNGAQVFYTNYAYKKSYITVGNASTNVLEEINNITHMFQRKFSDCR